jgi:hypothetical protein
MEEVQETQAAVLAGRRPKVAAAEPATREPAPPLADARPQRAGARKS